jgi:hypothetical protein
MRFWKCLITAASPQGNRQRLARGGPELDHVAAVVLRAEDHDAVLAGRRHLSLPQSSSASRRTASHAGFLLLSQSGERPERYVDIFRFDTMPSSPHLAGMSEAGRPVRFDVLVEPDARGRLGQGRGKRGLAAPPAGRGAGRRR